jgi:hypothetical protein
MSYQPLEESLFGDSIEDQYHRCRMTRESFYSDDIDLQYYLVAP